MRGFVVAATVLGLTLAATGCSSGSKKHAATTSTAPSASETLTIMGFGTGDEVATSRTAVATKAIAPARVSNPNGGFDPQQFLTRVASGNAPDLVYLDRQLVGTYAAKGVFRPLDSCISSQHVATSQYRPQALKEVTYKGHVYGIPEFFDNRTVIVNTALTPASAIDTSNWSKLKQTAKRLYRSSGGKVTRIGFDPKLPEFFPLWAKAAGVDLLSPDGLHAHLDDPHAIAALRYAAGLIDEQGGWSRFKAFRDTFDFFGAGNEFAKNQLGAFPMEDWYYNVLAQNSPQVKIAAVPFRAKSGGILDWATGSAWAIPKDAKHAQLACTWAKTMTEWRTWIVAAKARLAVSRKNHVAFTGLYTGNRVADAKIFATLYKPSHTVFDQAVKTVLAAQPHAFVLPASPAGAEFQSAWTDAVNRVLTGQQSAAASLHQAQRQAQAAIDAASG
jgi:multiple sugar transport system substrate-binding protein